MGSSHQDSMGMPCKMPRGLPVMEPTPAEQVKTAKIEPAGSRLRCSQLNVLGSLCGKIPNLKHTWRNSWNNSNSATIYRVTSSNYNVRLNLNSQLIFGTNALKH